MELKIKRMTAIIPIPKSKYLVSKLTKNPKYQ